MTQAGLDAQLAVNPDAAATVAIRADSGDVRVASQWLERAAASHGVPAEQYARLDQCLDEVLANIIRHGGEGARATSVQLHIDVLRAGADCEAAVTVSDGGIPFDPLTVVPRSRPADLAQAEPGGLGLLMMRSNADRLGYRFADGRNHLTFAVRWQDKP